MKKVFSGEIFEVLPLSNGIIFSYCKGIEDNKIHIAYKMISFENGQFSDVAKNIYMVTKFGNNYKAVMSLCDNYITVKSIVLPNNKVFLLDTNGIANLVDTDGVSIWTGEMKYKNYNASDVVLYRNSLWASFSECDVLLRYNLTSMREELRIGGVKSPFNKPKNMFVDGDNVMISNTGSRKLTEVNLNTYGVFEYESFEEPIYQYVRVMDYRFVVLKSGLYLI